MTLKIIRLEDRIVLDGAAGTLTQDAAAAAAAAVTVADAAKTVDKPAADQAQQVQQAPAQGQAPSQGQAMDAAAQSPLPQGGGAGAEATAHGVQSAAPAQSVAPAPAHDASADAAKTADAAVQTSFTSQDAQQAGPSPQASVAADSPVALSAPVVSATSQGAARDSSRQAEEQDGARVLLVSSNVPGKDTLVAAHLENVITLVYNESESPAELLQQLRGAVDGKSVSSIAFASQSDAAGDVRILDSMTLDSASVLSQPQIKAFWEGVGSLLDKDGRVDVLSCNAASTDKGAALLDALTTVTGHSVAASTDRTGNEAQGGNWVLETSGVNVAPIYFSSERLASYAYALDNQAPVVDVSGIAQAQTGDAQTVTPFSSPGGSIVISDADGDPLTVRVSFDSANGTFANAASLGFTGSGGTLEMSGSAGQVQAALQGLAFTPVKNADAVGVVRTTQFTVTASDGTDTTIVANAASIAAVSVNDAPTAVGDSYALHKDGSLTVAAAAGVLANDSDPDPGDSLTVVGVAAGLGPQHGTVSVNADGSFTYTPTAHYSGQDTFTYEVRDASNAVSRAQVTLDVRNDAPTAADKTLTTLEDTGLTLSKADFGFADPNSSDTLQAVKITSLPAKGTLTLDGAAVGTGQTVSAADIGAGKLVFTPALNGNGAGYAGFGFAVSDGQLFSASKTITVDVTAVNDAPTTADKTLTTLEDIPLVFKQSDFSFADVDTGDTLHAVKITSVPAKGTLTLDGQAVHAGDSIGIADIVAGKLRFLPAADENGANYAAIGFAVNDGQLDSAPKTITVNVTAVNDAPRPVADSYTVDEDTTLAVPAAKGVLANDSDPDAGDKMIAILVSKPQHGVLTFKDDGSFVYIPNGDYNGPDSFTYKVRDLSGAMSDVTTVNITVNPVNDAPTAASNILTTLEDTSLPIKPADLGFADVDGDPLHHITITSIAGGGKLLLNGTQVAVNAQVSAQDLADGHLTFVPADNANGPAYATIGFTASDGQSDSVAQKLTINVTPVNDAPVAAHREYTTAEDTKLTKAAGEGVLVGTVDPDAGDTLTAKLVSGPGHGTLLLRPNGAFVYTPAANYNGDDTFTYMAVDGAGASSQQTVTIHVTAVNDAPVAAKDAYTLAEDQPGGVHGNVLANDSDVDADPALNKAGQALDTLTVSGHTNPQHGTLVMAANGDFTYTPNANYNGPDSFTYTVKDSAGATSTATVTLNVTPVNDAPVAVTDTYRTNEDTALVIAAKDGVLANDSDVDTGDVLRAQLQTGPAHGTLTLEPDGSFKYVPTANYNGPDSFTYWAVDAAGEKSLATVNITVKAVNDAPVAVNDVVWTTSPFPLKIDALANDTDVDMDPALNKGLNPLDSIRITSFTNPSKGTVQLVNGAFEYSPTWPMLNLPDSFTYTITDSQGATSTATVYINTTPGGGTSHTPVAVDDHAQLAEDTSKVINVLANDTDPDLPNDTLTVVGLVAGQGPSHGAATLNPDGSFTYTPSKDFYGDDQFTYQVKDAAGHTATAVVYLTVTPVNDAPVAADTGYKLTEDQPLTVAAGDGLLRTLPLPNVTDADPHDVLSVIVVQGPKHGTLLQNPDGSFTYTPDADYNGPDVYTYQVKDAAGALSNTATVSLWVAAAKDAPVAAGDSYTMPEDHPGFTGNVLANDHDVDANSALNKAGQALDTFTLTAHTDPQHGTLTIAANGDFTYKPNADYNGPDSFTYTITDASGLTSTATVTLDITPVNDAPRNVSDRTYETNEDTPFVLPNASAGLLKDVFDVDDNDTITALLAPNSGPAHGTVHVNPDGTFSYIPDKDWNGTDTFQYYAQDGEGAKTEIKTVTIVVHPVNDAPVAKNDGYITDEDTKLVVPVGTGLLANDTDVDLKDTPNLEKLTVTSVTPPKDSSGVTQGTVTWNGDGSFEYMPSKDFNGVVTFAYTVTDKAGATATAVVTILVNPVNDAPVATDHEYIVNEDATLTAPKATGLLAGATDVDSTFLTAQLVAGKGPAHGTVTVNADGTFTYKPIKDYNGTDSFKYVVKDTEGGVSEERTANITVRPVNDPPVISVPSAQYILEDTSALIKIISVSDPDLENTGTINTTPFVEKDFTVWLGLYNNSGTLTLTGTNPNVTVGSQDFIFGNPDGSTFTRHDIKLTGKLSEINALLAQGVLYKPNANFNGQELVSVMANDNGNVSYNNQSIGSGTSFQINVAPVDDAPVITKPADQTVAEDTPLAFKAASGNAITIADIDAGPGTMKVTLSTGHGILNLGSLSGLSNIAYSANKDSVSFEGSLANINAALSGLTYQGAPDWYGNDKLTVYVSDQGNTGVVLDGKGNAVPAGFLTDTKEIAITVTPVADAPTVAPTKVVVSEDGSLGMTFLPRPSDTPGTASYADFQSVRTENGVALTPIVTPGVVRDGDINESYTVVSVQSIAGTTKGTVTLADGKIQYVPGDPFQYLALGEQAQDSFTYTLRGTNGQEITQTMLVTVEGRNDAPTSKNTYAEVAENGTVTVTLGRNANTAPDAATYNFNIATTGDHVNAQPATQAVARDIDSTDSMTITGAAAIAGTTKGMVSLADGKITYNPGTAFDYLSNGQTAQDSFTYTLTDKNGLTTTSTMFVTVYGKNDAPAMNIAPIRVSEDGSLGVGIGANAVTAPGASTFNLVVDRTDDGTTIQVVQKNAITDPDSADNYTLTGVASIAGTTKGTVTLVDGKIQYVPGAPFQYLAVGEQATDTFEYTLSDGHGGVITQVMTVIVEGRNDAPTSQNTTATVSENGTLSIGLAKNPSTAPNAASYSFDVNRTEEGVTTPQSVQPVGSDIDSSDTLTLTRVDALPSTKGTVTIGAGGRIQYDPGTAFDYLNAGETAHDYFTYTLSDGHGGTTTATMDITILGKNDAPVAHDVTVRISEDGRFSTSMDTKGQGQITRTDDGAVTVRPETLGTDVDATAVLTVKSFDAVSQEGGKVTLNPDGSFTYVPSSKFQSLGVGEQATDSFTYTITDDNGATSTATITVIIDGRNDAPIVTPLTVRGDEDHVISQINLLAQATDVDVHDLLSVTASTTSAAGATITRGADGNFIYNPGDLYQYLAVGETARDSFTYTISDGHGGVTVGTVTVIIDGRNDLPASQNFTFTVPSGGQQTLDASRFTFADIDRSDTLHAVRITSLPENGYLTLDGNRVGVGQTVSQNDLASGRLSFVSTNASYTAQSASFTFQVYDGYDYSSDYTADVSLPGAQQPAVIAATTNGAPLTILPNPYDVQVGDAFLDRTGATVAVQAPSYMPDAVGGRTALGGVVIQAGDALSPTQGTGRPAPGATSLGAQPETFMENSADAIRLFNSRIDAMDVFTMGSKDSLKLLNVAVHNALFGDNAATQSDAVVRSVASMQRMINSMTPQELTGAKSIIQTWIRAIELSARNLGVDVSVLRGIQERLNAMA